VSNDTNGFLQFPFVNEAMLLEIQIDIGRFREMTPMTFFPASPLIPVMNMSLRKMAAMTSRACACGAYRGLAGPVL
jgi:hypothetical protein